MVDDTNSEDGNPRWGLDLLLSFICRKHRPTIGKYWIVRSCRFEFEDRQRGGFQVTKLKVIVPVKSISTVRQNIRYWLNSLSHLARPPKPNIPQDLRRPPCFLTLRDSLNEFETRLMELKSLSIWLFTDWVSLIIRCQDPANSANLWHAKGVRISNTKICLTGQIKNPAQTKASALLELDLVRFS
jgi:hypothetical protein